MKQLTKRVLSSASAHLFKQRRDSLASRSRPPQNLLDRLILDELIRRSADSDDLSTLRSYLSTYWQGTSGDNFYQSFPERFDEWFLGPHYKLYEQLFDLVERYPGRFQQLIEVGCGDGRVLNHLSGKLPQIEKCTGIDINDKIIADNNRNYSSERIHFVAGDATEWIRDNAQPGTILTSYGGVLEYFLEEELATIFRLARKNTPSMVALVEPIYGDFDPDTEIRSRPSGAEHSFSHNYRHLLTSAGYEIRFEEIHRMEFRWMMMLAMAD